MEFKKYPKIRAFGQDGTEDILNGDIVIQPKVDGSNVSVYVYQNEPTRLARRNGFIDFGSRQFKEFVEWVEAQEPLLNRLREGMESDPTRAPKGYIFYGEYSNNHNKLKYDRKSPFILFDILEDYGDKDEHEDWQGPKGEFCDYETVKVTATELGWDYIPAIYEGDGGEWTLEKLEELIDRESYLGGCKEEGIVVKRYGALTRYHRVYFCKLVAADFKEKIKVKEKINQGGSVGDWIADSYLNPARVRKAIQKMKEDDQWDETYARKNIGKLIGVVTKDIHEEAYDEIAERAAKVAWRDGARIIATKVAPLLDEVLKEDN